MTNKISAIIAAALLLTISVSAQSAPDGITSGQQLQKQAESVTRDIGTQELKTMLDDELEMVLIDIRTTDEVKNMGGTIDAIQNSVIPRGWLEFRVSKVAQNKDTPSWSIAVQVFVVHWRQKRYRIWDIRMLRITRPDLWAGAKMGYQSSNHRLRIIPVRVKTR